MLKAERLVAITLLLQARGKMTAEQLAAILGVSVRTIYRDMDSLSLAHVPVSMDYGPGGGYFLPDDYRLEPATFTSEEAVALALGGAMAGSSRLFESNDGLRRALFKLEAILPEEYRSDVRAARERILFDAEAWHRQPVIPHHLETVRSAVWEGRQLDVHYHPNDDQVQWRRIEPYGLVCKAGVWYLAAYCHLRQDFRTFRVARIMDVTVREEPVTPRPDFDLRRYWEGARQRFEDMMPPFVVTMRVKSTALHRMLEEFRVVQEDERGTVVEVRLDSPHSALRLALWMGGDAQVLDPLETAREVAEVAQAIAAQYEAHLRTREPVHV